MLSMRVMRDNYVKEGCGSLVVSVRIPETASPHPNSLISALTDNHLYHKFVSGVIHSLQAVANRFGKTFRSLCTLFTLCNKSSADYNTTHYIIFKSC